MVNPEKSKNWKIYLMKFATIAPKPPQNPWPKSALLEPNGEE